MGNNHILSLPLIVEATQSKGCWSLHQMVMGANYSLGLACAVSGLVTGTLVSRAARTATGASGMA